MRSILWIATFLCLSTIICVAQASDPTLVPAGSLPTMDGTLSPGEWDDALLLPLSANFTVFLKHANGYLFLGIQATTQGVPSPMIVRGGEIYVLHASAALGTAIYAQHEDVWSLSQAFAWQCRSLGFSEAAQADRNRFLKEEGWLATIGYLGTPTMFEYQILLDEQPLQMLFLFLETTTPLLLVSWPITSESASIYTEIITGPIPSEASFCLEDWMTLAPVIE